MANSMLRGKRSALGVHVPTADLEYDRHQHWVDTLREQGCAQQDWAQSEAERLRERIEELMNGNTALRVEDKNAMALALYYGKVLACLGASIAAWDAGCTVTDETLLAGFRLWFNSFLPLSQQAYEESTGARREAQRIMYQLLVVIVTYPSVRTEQAAALVHEGLHKRAPADALFEACAAHDFKR